MYCHPKTKAIWQVIYEFLLQQEENMKPQSRDQKNQQVINFVYLELCGSIYS